MGFNGYQYVFADVRALKNEKRQSFKINFRLYTPGAPGDSGYNDRYVVHNGL